MSICYLDYNATTPIAPEVREGMLPYLGERYGNPSSLHAAGKESLSAINKARESVAKLLVCDVREVVFTSGATESNNHAIRAALKLHPKRKRIVTTSVEHSSVRSILKYLSESEGSELTILQVDSNGNLDLKQLESALNDEVALVSVMWANNETGVVFPIDAISKIAQKKNILLHVDAVQAIGKLGIDLSKTKIDFLSLSTHKFYGPKGAGILYANRKIELPPFIIGGSQERGRRGGTENLLGIVGTGKAAQMISEGWRNHAATIELLRNRLEAELLKQIPHSFVNGAASERICNTSNIAFPGTVSEIILPLLDERGICASSGAACLTGAVEPSHVLLAMGLSREQALSSVRFSLGWGTTQKEIDYAIEVIPEIIKRIRQSECSIP